MGVPALVMPSCKSGATSFSYLNTEKTKNKNDLNVRLPVHEKENPVTHTDDRLSKKWKPSEVQKRSKDVKFQV